MASNNIRYLNEKKVKSLEVSKKVKMIIGGFFGTFNLFATVYSITEKDVTGFVFFLIVLIAFGFLFWSGLKIGFRIEAARRYETVFGSDRDGDVTVEELSTIFGKPGHKLISELDKLFRMGLFQNCTLQQGGHPGVILNDANIGESGVGFIDCKCPNCGGMNRLRAGVHGKCTYCGSPLAGQ